MIVDAASSCYSRAQSRRVVLRKEGLVTFPHFQRKCYGTYQGGPRPHIAAELRKISPAIVKVEPVEESNILCRSSIESVGDADILRKEDWDFMLRKRTQYNERQKGNQSECQPCLQMAQLQPEQEPEPKPIFETTSQPAEERGDENVITCKEEILRPGIRAIVSRAKKDTAITKKWILRCRENIGVSSIIKRDGEALAAMMRWTKYVALPAFINTVLLKSFEDPSLDYEVQESWQQRDYAGLSGWALVAADVSMVEDYFKYLSGGFAVWRTPLKLKYEPKKLADYFNSRPHILFLRIFQVTGECTSLFLWFVMEKVFQSLYTVKADKRNTLDSRLAEKFKALALRLGPTFTKVAQSLSTRPDLMGPDAAKVLVELQDRLPSFSNKVAMDVIEKDLGFPATQIFEFLSPEPVAAASLGQVYKGRTIDGKDVAVKVQRPNLLFYVACDLYILRSGLKLFQKMAGIRSDLSLFVDEIGKGIYGELDYNLEARNALAFWEALSPKLPFIVVPKPLMHLTTTRVLTMEWIEGDRPFDINQIAKGRDGISTLEQQEAAKAKILLMVNRGVQSSLTQLLDVGILHADPHPGNLLYTSDNKIGYLDFGLICYMKNHHKYAIISAIAHLVNGEWQCLVEDLADLGVLRPSSNKFALQLALANTFSGLVFKDGIPDIRFSQMAGSLFDVALKFRLQLPAYFTLVLRSIASLEGMALNVDPSFKVFTKTYPFVVRHLIFENSSMMRRTLHSLLLDRNRELRWDRITTFIKIFKAVAEHRASIGLNNSEDSIMKDEPALAFCKIFLSNQGTSLRRIFIEADSICLAEKFLSSEAFHLRCSIVGILTATFFELGRRLFKQRLGLCLPWAIKEDAVKSVSSVFSADLKNRRLRFLANTMFFRLVRTPLLALRLAWTGFTIFAQAFAFACHGLAIALADYYFDPFSTRCMSLP